MYAEEFAVWAGCMNYAIMIVTLNRFEGISFEYVIYIEAFWFKSNNQYSGTNKS